MFTTLTNDTKQLINKAREEREKNSQTNFDTLNTPKETLDEKKKLSAEEKRETNRTLTPITTLITYDDHDGR